MSHPENIVIVGTGLMGAGIAQVFACAGHQVCLVDIDPAKLEQARSTVADNLQQMLGYGITFKEDVDGIVARLRTTTDLEAACAGCDFAFEAIYENLELKQKLMSDLDRCCPPGAILCSNTSVISITEIAALADNKARILGTHWWNPAYLIPLVEVVRTASASEDCVKATYDLLKRVGKHPVHVHKDVPGFIGNRLQHALWREAFALIDDGICSPAAVDETIRNGFGLRLPILGPVENADMVGLDLTFAIHDYLLKYLNASPTCSTTLQAKVARGDLGFKSGAGFLPWSESAIAASRDKLKTYLLKALAEQAPTA